MCIRDREIPEEETIGTYTTPVNVDKDELEVSNKIITLKNDLGKMRKRRKFVMRYHKFSKFTAPEQYQMKVISWILFQVMRKNLTIFSQLSKRIF